MTTMNSNSQEQTAQEEQQQKKELAALTQYLKKRPIMQKQIRSLEKNDPRRKEIQNEVRRGFWKHIAPLGPLITSQLLQAECRNMT